MSVNLECLSLSLCLSLSPCEEEDSLSLAKDNSHNSSFELLGSMIPSYQPINHQRSTGRGGVNAALFRSPSPCLFRPSFLGSASKVIGRWSDAVRLSPGAAVPPIVWPWQSVELTDRKSVV